MEDRPVINISDKIVAH